MDQRKCDAVQPFDALYGMSNEELLSELETAMSRADTEAFDPDYVEACLRILQDRDPVMEDFDPQQALQSLPLDPKRAGVKARRRHRRLKVLRALEIAAVLVVLLAVAATAGGYNPMDWLRSINADTVSFGVNPSGELEIVDAEPQMQEGGVCIPAGSPGRLRRHGAGQPHLDSGGLPDCVGGSHGGRGNIVSVCQCL